MTMNWYVSWRTDRNVRPLADRHYNRQSIGHPNFVPPGRCFVLKTKELDNRERGAYWVTSWPFAQYVRHAWAGAWMNSAFRNEAQHLYLSSDIIREAVAATRWKYGEPPELGMVTFVDPTKVRHKRDAGRCYRKAGFVEVGKTKSGLIALEMFPNVMPEPRPPCEEPNLFNGLLL